MSHDAAMELVTAGAALGDLAPDELAPYAAHRRWCLDCRRMERDLEQVLADLSLDAPRRVPPPELFGAVLAGIRASDLPPVGDVAAAPAGIRPVGTSPARAVRVRVSGRTIGGLALVAALALAVAGLGVRDVARQQQLDSSSATIDSLEQALAGRDGAMTVAMDPGRVAVALQAEALAPAAQAAVVYVPGSSNAWIVVRNLPASPAGHAYQLWVADAAGVHPLEVLPFDGTGPFIAPVEADLASAAAVMVTLETASGAQGEPGPQVVFGHL
jgi:anti-sigma-K factor RskA